VDPAAIVSSNARRHLPHKTLSKTTISALHPDETPPLTDDDGDSDLDSDSNPGGLTMSPAELRVIRRLADRVNVLPVIGRADSLTDDKLRAVKATVKRELYEADLGFGVFTPEPVKFFEPSSSKEEGVLAADGDDVNGDIYGDGTETDSESDEEDDTHPSRPVIRLRTGRQSVPPRRSRSRSRLELPEEAREPQSPDPLDPESVANVRFSASSVARSDLSPLLPFAIIAPEKYRWHKPKPAAEASVRDGVSENVGPLTSNSDSPITPAGKGQTLSHANSVPDDLKGVFVRRFRWGKVDVLDPTHCDFAALRTAVLSTHMKVTTFLSAGVYLWVHVYHQVLKTHTREVLYENFRTEKLLARRATRKIGEEQTKKLLEGVLSFLICHVFSTNSTFRSRVVKFALAGSEYSLGQIWIPLILPSTCVCLPTFSTHPWSSIYSGFIFIALRLPALFCSCPGLNFTTATSCPPLPC
jgi:hypothetical protein